MARSFGYVTIFMFGVLITIIVDPIIFSKTNIHHSVSTLMGNSSPNMSTTLVYRYDGTRIRQLQDFCTWTLPMDCVILKSPSGPTPIYIHDIKVDFWVSKGIKLNGVWEQKNINLIMHLLQKDKDLGFMDIGSHVGAFSLSVGKTGRKVVSFDPLIENVQRLCKSVQKNRLTDKVTIVFNPLSDKRIKIDMRRDGGHIAGSTLVAASTLTAKTPCQESVDTYSILLDDIIPYLPFNKAVMKMDVQEHEYFVLKGATRFFQMIQVPAILMEWDLMRKVPEGEKLVKLLLGYNYRAFAPQIQGKLLDPKKFKNWPYDVLWLKQK